MLLILILIIAIACLGLYILFRDQIHDWITVTFDIPNPAPAPSEPKGPASEPKGPASEPKGPASEPKGPASEPKGPASEPKGPASEPKGPASEPKGPASEPKGPASEPKGPASEPKGPASEPEPSPNPAPSEPEPSPNPAPAETYAWETGSWSDCDELCNGGTQTRSVKCMTSTGKPAASIKCPRTRPVAFQTCNTQACTTYSYKTGSWGGCSATCGGGTQNRSVSCVSSDGRTVADSQCSGTKPATSQRCNTQACPPPPPPPPPPPLITNARWWGGDWSRCNAECGGGTQTRQVACRWNGTGAYVNESACDSTKKLADRQACNTQACPTPPAPSASGSLLLKNATLRVVQGMFSLVSRVKIAEGPYSAGQTIRIEPFSNSFARSDGTSLTIVSDYSSQDYVVVISVDDGSLRFTGSNGISVDTTSSPNNYRDYRLSLGTWGQIGNRPFQIRVSRA
jgi:hypothetical protein